MPLKAARSGGTIRKPRFVASGLSSEGTSDLPGDGRELRQLAAVRNYAAIPAKTVAGCHCLPSWRPRWGRSPFTPPPANQPNRIGSWNGVVPRGNVCPRPTHGGSLQWNAV